MITRRCFVAQGTASGVTLAAGRTLSARTRRGRERPARGYAEFLGEVRRDAHSLGVEAGTIAAALSLSRPNPTVLRSDRHQPEFSLSWQDYRAAVVSDQRIAKARACYAARLGLLDDLSQRYQVDRRILVAIWGIESDFGDKRGDFGVFDALATLAFASRRPGFFRGELLDGLQIPARQGIPPELMRGSYAGAMGQPQFMPSSYLRYAVDFDGDGRPDIWSSDQDSLASIANYLARNGWLAGAPWGQEISMVSAGATGVLPPPSSGTIRSLGEWMDLGIRRIDGSKFSRSDIDGQLLQPDGAAGETFLTYDNFSAILSYNRSDFYALSVGLLAAAIA